MLCKCAGVCRHLPLACCDEHVLCCFPDCRAGPGVHRVPQSRVDDACVTTLGHTLLLNAADAGARQSGESFKVKLKEFDKKMVFRYTYPAQRTQFWVKGPNSDHKEPPQYFNVQLHIYHIFHHIQSL